ITSIPPQSVIKSTVGAMVVGLMIQQLLLGMIVLWGSRYYVRFHFRDTWFYQSIVGALLVLNALEFSMDFHVLYRTTVTYYGQYAFFDLQTWTMWAEPGITVYHSLIYPNIEALTSWRAAIGLLAQVFFIQRCWKVTHESWPVLIFLVFLLLLCFGPGMAVSVSFAMVRLFSQIAKISIPICLWLISTAVTDVAIAGILCTKLYRSNSDFKRTGAVVRRIMYLSVETSAITAFIATVNLVFYFTWKDSAWHLVPQFSICRVYTITVLVTLLSATIYARHSMGQRRRSAPLRSQSQALV
ncbi:hypothetical protein B0H13DRAFT_1636010, partial [Mycena leptocephala]